MNDILNYVKTNENPFTSQPFNEVDALVLSWLAYYRYPEYAQRKAGTPLRNMQDKGLLPDAQMYADAFSPKTSKKLFTFAAQSPRFGGVEISDYKFEKDEKEEKQFAAICMKISENEYYLSFRGTDPSFVGWKEDFNLACRCPVPSQTAALEYAEAEISKRPNAKFYLGGHSKGGNVACYAAIKARGKYQKSVISVYNFDGPGFINDIYSESGFKRVEKKLIKIVPKASFVGMLFETRNDFSIIQSKNLSVLQHDPFSWRVSGNKFKYIESRSPMSIQLEKGFNDWITELTVDERKRVISIIYNAMNTLDTRDFNVFFRTLHRQIPALYREYRDLGEDDKKFMGENLKRLFKYMTGKKRGKNQGTE